VLVREQSSSRPPLLSRLRCELLKEACVGVLAMLELDGETAALMAATEELERLLPPPEGLLVRVVAPTADGIVLFQLWKSQEARQRNAENPHHASALEASGMRGAVRGSRSRAFEDAQLEYLAREAAESERMA
jgi:hypothetical protein